jgi:hypothetical protein
MSAQTRRSPRFGHASFEVMSELFGRKGGRAIAAQINSHITPSAPVAMNAVFQPY